MCHHSNLIQYTTGQMSFYAGEVCDTQEVIVLCADCWTEVTPALVPTLEEAYNLQQQAKQLWEKHEDEIRYKEFYNPKMQSNPPLSWPAIEALGREASALEAIAREIISQVYENQTEPLPF